MGRKRIDITNQRFGKLVVLAYLQETNKWKCLCDCGNTRHISKCHLTSGSTNSCGCLRKPHGLQGSRTYVSWNAMLQRCNNPNNHNYFKYGAVGVHVIDRWNPLKGGSFINFLEDMGVRPDGTSLNRINSALIYSKETCEWADTATQAYDQKIRKDNTTKVAGVRFRKERNAYEARISKDGVQYLLYYGSSLEEAIQARNEGELKFYGVIKSSK